MTNTQKALCRNPTISNNSHQSGHENRNDTLHGIKGANMSGHANITEVDSHTGEV